METPEGLHIVHEMYESFFSVPTQDADKYDAIEIPMAVIIANRLERHPVWMLLVAAPGSGKTRRLAALESVLDTYSISTMTPQTFASGYITDDDSDRSLLPKLSGNTILMPDFGSIMSLHKETKVEVYSQLREIYDGHYVKEFGTGKRFEWRGKIGLLAGTTSYVYREYALTTQLGERFLMFCLPDVVESDQLTTEAMGQKMNVSDMRFVRLQLAVTRYLEAIGEKPDEPACDHAIKLRIAHLAQIVACGRAAVIFDEQGNIDFVAQPELPTRLGQQLFALGCGLAILRGEAALTDRIFKTLTRVAYDTIPESVRAIIRLLSTRQTIDVKMITQMTGLSKKHAARMLDGTVARRLATKEEGGGRINDHYHPSSNLIKWLGSVNQRN